MKSSHINIKRIRGWAVLMSGLMAITSAVGKEPTHRDLRYSSEFDRSVMDLWLPDSEQPTPLVVYFHGGGFIGGTRGNVLFREDWLSLLDRGVAVASVGYPFLGDQGKTTRIGPAGFDAILSHTEKAIRFLIDRADDYRLDVQRLVAAGSSSGALISEHLTYAADLGISLCVAIEQPFEVNRVMAIIDEGESPIIFYTRSAPSNAAHSPAFAKTVHEHCEEIGVSSEVFGSAASGLPPLPEGMGLFSYVYGMMVKLWEGGKDEENLEIHSLVLEDERWQLSFRSSDPGGAHEVQASSSLKGGSWQVEENVAFEPSGNERWQAWIGHDGAPRRFFRVVRQR